MKVPRRALYIRQAPYPWDVRAEKICKALQAHGYEVEILARRGKGQPAEGESNGIRIHRVGPERPRAASLPVPGNPLWQGTLARRIRAFRPDILIARDIPVAPFARIAAHRFGIPWVIDMAEHYPAAMRSWKKYDDNLILRTAVNTLRIPDRIERRAVLEEQKSRLVDAYGVAPDRIVTVMNTPERDAFADVGPAARNRSTWRFGYHGFAGRDRDLMTLMRGFDLAVSSGLSVTLEIAGGGEALDELRAEATRLANGSRITFRGAFAPSETKQLYSEVDFGIVPCQVNPFTQCTVANKFFDYAACGRPFIFTATRPTERLMEIMRCGMCYEGGNPESVAAAISRIVEANYDELARNGLDAIRDKFNWECDAARMLAFLDRVTDMAGYSPTD
jgi:glycosyltransferase involved in cell wall biosynthesis